MVEKLERGFTLLEVLVAFVILALGMGVMFDGVTGGLRATKAADLDQEAVSLARSHLAAITKADFATEESEGDDGGGFAWRTHIAPVETVILPRAPNATMTNLPPRQATLYAVSVDMEWTFNGNRRRLELETARIGP